MLKSVILKCCSCVIYSVNCLLLGEILDTRSCQVSALTSDIASLVKGVNEKGEGLGSSLGKNHDTSSKNLQSIQDLISSIEVCQAFANVIKMDS